MLSVNLLIYCYVSWILRHRKTFPEIFKESLHVLFQYSKRFIVSTFKYLVCLAFILLCNVKHTSKLVSKMAIPLFSTLLDNYCISLPDLRCNFYEINSCTDYILIYFWNFCFLMLAFQFINNSAHSVLIFKAYIYICIYRSSSLFFISLPLEIFPSFSYQSIFPYELYT